MGYWGQMCIVQGVQFIYRGLKDQFVFPIPLTGLLCMCRRRGVSAGADLRPSHCDTRRRAGGPDQLLSGPRVLWGAHRSAGGRVGPRTRPHGNVHRARHPLLQVQTSKNEGALGALLVKSQHPEGRLSLCLGVCLFHVICVKLYEIKFINVSSLQNWL